jgi:hypothetical protein
MFLFAVVVNGRKGEVKKDRSKFCLLESVKRERRRSVDGNVGWDGVREGKGGRLRVVYREEGRKEQEEGRGLPAVEMEIKKNRKRAVALVCQIQMGRVQKGRDAGEGVRRKSRNEVVVYKQVGEQEVEGWMDRLRFLRFITFQEEQKEFGCQEICEVTTREREKGRQEGEKSE